MGVRLLTRLVGFLSFLLVLESLCVDLSCFCSGVLGSVGLFVFFDVRDSGFLLIRSGVEMMYESSILLA